MSNEVTMYKYTAYGLKIASEFQLGTTPSESFEEVDLVIRKGIVIEKVDDPIAFTKESSFNETEFILFVKNVAKFWARDGKEIVVETTNYPDYNRISIFLTSNIIGIIMYQRGIFPLHAGSVRLHDEAIFFMGDSGAGKSTICQEFISHGAKFVSDDIVTLAISANDALINPGFFQQKLWKSVMERYNLSGKGAKEVHQDMDKYIIPVQQDEVYSMIPIRAGVILKQGNVEKVTIRQLSFKEAFLELMRNTQYAYYTTMLHLEEKHFDYCYRLAKVIDLYELIRPVDIFTAPEQYALILKEVLKHGKEVNEN